MTTECEYKKVCELYRPNSLCSENGHEYCSYYIKRDEARKLSLVPRTTSAGACDLETMIRLKR